MADSTELAGIILELNNGLRLTADDWGPDEAWLQVNVPNKGQLVIGVELWEGDQLVAEGDVSWRLEHDYEWNMHMFRRASDPTEGCFGCLGSVRLPVAEWAAKEPEEALWFIQGGLPRGSDVVS